MRAAFAAVLLAALAPGVRAQAPAVYTYQGRLQQSGQPVSADRQVEIRLCDALTGGTCYGTGVQGVSVLNGVFKTTFTTPAFPGGVGLHTGSWFLEIAASDGAILNTLAPRERLSSLVYALYASSASTLIPQTGASSVVVASPLVVSGSTVTAAGFAGSGSALTGVTAETVGTNGVSNAAIVAGAVDASKLAVAAVTAAAIAPAAVDASKLAAAAVTTNALAAAAVDSTKIAGFAVTGPKIASQAVDVTKLAPSSVDASKLAPASVEADKLAAGAVTSGALGIGAVTAGALAAAAVETGKIAPGAVDSTKLAPGAVSTEKIAPGSVVSASIAPGAVDTGKLASGVLIGFDGSGLVGLRTRLAYSQITGSPANSMTTGVISVRETMVIEIFINGSVTPTDINVSFDNDTTGANYAITRTTSTGGAAAATSSDLGQPSLPIFGDTSTQRASVVLRVPGNVVSSPKGGTVTASRFSSAAIPPTTLTGAWDWDQGAITPQIFQVTVSGSNFGVGSYLVVYAEDLP